MTRSKSTAKADPLATLRAHPRVASAYEEHNGNHGDTSDVWVDLARGWAFEGGHQIHEGTVDAALQRVEWAEPCDCDECAPPPL